MLKKPDSLKEITKRTTYEIELEDEEPKEGEKQVTQKDFALTEEEKISRMISSHLKSLLKKYDINKISNMERNKIKI